MVERIRSRRRRIMKEFVIREVSAVDRPCQEHARAVILKRDDEQQEHNMGFEKITRVGFTRGADAPLAFDSLESAVRHLRKVHGMTGLDAMEQVATTRPDLVREYNTEGAEIAKAAAERSAPRPVAKAVQDFNKRVSEVQARDKCTKLEALERAAREFPLELAAFQGA